MTRPPLTTAPWSARSWVPPTLSRRDVVSLIICWGIVVSSRAWDYLTPIVEHDQPRAAYTIIEAAMPLWVWGLLIAAPLAVLVISMIRHVHAGVWAGLMGIAVVYLGLGCGLTVEYLTREWADGIRAGLPPLGLAYSTGLIGLRTGWRPPAWTSSR